MQILNYLFILFFKVYSMREFITLALTICYCLIAAEDKPDQKIIKRLDYIRDNTHEKILLPLSVTEMAILSNLGSNISKVIEFKDNNGKVREYPLHQLVRYSKDSYFELAKFAVEIAKKYSLDIPMRTGQEAFELPVAPPDLIGGDAAGPG
jgi:hypothetical protein